MEIFYSTILKTNVVTHTFIINALKVLKINSKYFCDHIIFPKLTHFATIFLL